MRDLTRHFSHWASLAGVIVIAGWGLINFSYDRAFQSAIAISLGAAFVVWGIVHHHIHEDLHPKIILEYVAMAAFGVVALLAVIWRA